MKIRLTFTGISLAVLSGCGALPSSTPTEQSPAAQPTAIEVTAEAKDDSAYNAEAITTPTPQQTTSQPQPSNTPDVTTTVYIKETTQTVTHSETIYKYPERGEWVTRTWNQQYTNPISGYSLSLPDWMLNQHVASEDGRSATFSDGTITLNMGSTNRGKNPRSMEQLKDAVENTWNSRGAEVTLSEISNKKYTVSGHHGDDIFYERWWVGSGSTVSMSWKYPKDYKEYMDDIVTRSVKSLSTGDLTTSYPR